MALRKNAHAVVIGINKYKDNRIADLRLARADAESVYDILIDPNMGRFPEENVIKLVDEQATFYAIRKAIGATVANKAKADHEVFIYFSGHGCVAIDNTGRYSDGLEKYLVPCNGEADDLFSSALSMKFIETELLIRIKSKRVVFIIDSCYSGQVAAGAGSVEAYRRSFDNPDFSVRAMMTEEHLNKLSADGRVVLSACNVNETSLELPDMDNGLFTHYFLKGVKGAADSNNGGIVTLDELYQYVSDKVSSHAQSIGAQMHPVRAGKVVGDLFLFEYETPEKKRLRELRQQADQICREADKLFEDGRTDAAFDEYQKALALWPDHPAALSKIAAIEQLRRLSEAENWKILNRRLSVLFNLYDSGKLSTDRYRRARRLLQKKPSDLDPDTRKIQQRLYDLTDQKISLETFFADALEIRRKALAKQPQKPGQSPRKPAASRKPPSGPTPAPKRKPNDAGKKKRSRRKPAATPAKAPSKDTAPAGVAAVVPPARRSPLRRLMLSIGAGLLIFAIVELWSLWQHEEWQPQEPGIYLLSPGKTGDAVADLEILVIEPDSGYDNTDDRIFNIKEWSGGCLVRDVPTDKPLDWYDVGDCPPAPENP